MWSQGTADTGGAKRTPSWQVRGQHVSTSADAISAVILRKLGNGKGTRKLKKFEKKVMQDMLFPLLVRHSEH